MTTYALRRTTSPPAPASHSLAALARADARRFARHPLFLFGAAALAALVIVGLAQHAVVDVAVMEGTVAPALFLGVFGFVVAHRLTTSLRRTGDLADTAPIGQQRRTMALCLACLVPFAAGVIGVAFMIVFGLVWPPVGIPDTARVAWFGDEPASAVVAALVANVPVAALGGSLLGVAVGRWAPFRGSAVLGMVLLVTVTVLATGLKSPWFAAAPYVNFSDSIVIGGRMRSSWIREDVSPVWSCAYALSLCGLTVVAALLRDKPHRRRLLAVGGVVGACALVTFVLSVS